MIKEWYYNYIYNPINKYIYQPIKGIIYGATEKTEESSTSVQEGTQHSSSEPDVTPSGGDNDIL
ncbi:hypothetical protein [Wolbachia endosymbiont of Ctenocephalides felis wCfeT]|uniref:hypothetical protein n=1 Tax=Wolbachia endosymbiont of Ctenocephalides felis wCfeT TaxID=2732593 RepID=UPI001445B558|nr:hypothetical protein [Wolbachia endosymbiont of Ctenocephalides felis wCfeT]